MSLAQAIREVSCEGGFEFGFAWQQPSRSQIKEGRVCRHIPLKAIGNEHLPNGLAVWRKGRKTLFVLETEVAQ